jgi:uncharacterized phage protein (TIGR02218 family)
MKTVSASLKQHLEQPVTTLAQCWKITRRDGTVLGFTDHDRDLVYGSVTYQARTGFTPSAIASHSDLAVDNLDIEGLLDAATITAADIEAGRYDYAEIEIFLLNYADFSQGILKLRRGWVGEVTLRGGRFVAEIRGLTQKLSQQIGEIYSPTCRAHLGDSRCGVNLTSFTATGTVTQVVSSLVIQDNSRTEAAGVYKHGLITFTTGPNAGLSREIKDFSNKQIVLALPFPHLVAVGHTYTISQGCDKTLKTCISRFGNAVNFRGEPHVPGLDRMLETAGTRSDW